MEIKRKRYSLYLVIGLLLFLFCFLYPFPVTIESNPISVVAVDYLKKDMIIEKEFIVKYNDLNELKLKFATYQKTDNKGLLNIVIIEKESNNKILDKDINIQEIKDNEYYVLNLPHYKIMKNKIYKIRIKVKNIEEESLIGIYGYTSESEKMFINGQETNNNITIIYNTKKPNYSLLFYPVIYYLIILLIEVFRKK